MNCLDSIRTLLQEKKCISFEAFMHYALYAPDVGYYSSALPKFGKTGDFITAPELSPLFGYTLANQCQQVLSTLKDPLLFEFGAGSGQLCVDVLTQLEALGSLPQAYHIIEVSAHLQLRQRALIQEKIPHLLEKVVWLSAWPTTPFNGVILANEVLDAMPIHRFLKKDGQLLESYIRLNDQQMLQEDFLPCVNQRLLDYLQIALPIDLDNYLSEANLFLENWLQQCSNMLNQGAMFILDYGFPRHEYYHADRTQGTLMCHYQHHAHPYPLLNPGEQDITAHVDFTHVAEAAHAAGFSVAGYTNQASFLIANGLLSLLEETMKQTTSIEFSQAVKKLLQPQEMGELFKVIALTKGMDLALTGFQLHDKRASL